MEKDAYDDHPSKSAAMDLLARYVQAMEADQKANLRPKKVADLSDDEMRWNKFPALPRLLIQTPNRVAVSCMAE